MDPEYRPSAMETRTVFGLRLVQARNDALIGPDMFTNIVSANKEVRLCESSKRVATSGKMSVVCSAL